MKTIIATLTLILFSFTMKAQDKIILMDSTSINGIVTEINTTSVKFQKNQNGPIYVIDKSTVARIEYQNGTTEVITPKSTSPHNTTSVPSPNTEKERIGRYNPNAPESNIPAKKYGGPRIGMTYISDGTLATRIGTNVVSQFGWQFETRFFTTQNGSSGLFEFIPLVGGMERGVFLPSASALIGFRSATGYEFGCGPNLSASGFGMVFAGGTSFQMGNVCIPVNVAFQPNIIRHYSEYNYDPATGQSSVTNIKKDTGFRISLLIGFNSRTH